MLVACLIRSKELSEQLYTICSKLANKSLEIKPSVNVITVQEAKLL